MSQKAETTRQRTKAEAKKAKTYRQKKAKLLLRSGAAEMVDDQGDGEMRVTHIQISLGLCSELGTRHKANRMARVYKLFVFISLRRSNQIMATQIGSLVVGVVLGCLGASRCPVQTAEEHPEEAHQLAVV